MGKFTDNINTRVQLEKGLKLRSGNDMFDLILYNNVVLSMRFEPATS